jgi:hypothetical protein
VTIDMSAILAAPEDDAPRWALARELEAANDPRGRFITVQLRASEERKAKGGSRDYWSLDATSEAMLETHRAAWTREVLPLVQEARFHRGFIESVTMDARTFLARGLELYRLAPIRSVTLTGAKPVMPEVAGSQLLRRLVHLGLQSNDLGDAGATSIARSTQLTNLRLLDLSFDGITAAGLDTIAASLTLAKLAFINLAGNPCGQPYESFAVDEMTGEMVPGSWELPEAGQAIEAKHGPRAWLHAPSRMRAYPPTIEDV